ncbi:hypothetical protein Mth01_45750 [Sphaerimonospora thailandensis]|uniref:Uncharacterized protein n=1 Tax=Sphaerimonospora thailandensis TaxID=795644 RepID=A0A8J3RAX2_9ACTN|nr:hypothetical protein Mth01_45750 [Sphaerimonospora thailandensis]
MPGSWRDGNRQHPVATRSGADPCAGCCLSAGVTTAFCLVLGHLWNTIDGVRPPDVRCPSWLETADTGSLEPCPHSGNTPRASAIKVVFDLRQETDEKTGAIAFIVTQKIRRPVPLGGTGLCRGGAMGI